MTKSVNLFDVVALTQSLPKLGLYRGQVGTIVEELAADTFEVEFSDNNGTTYATAPVGSKDLIVLHYHPLDEEAVA